MRQQQERRSRGKKPEYQVRIAKERIDILLGLAKKEIREHPDRSRRYVQLARKIGMRYNVRIPAKEKRGLCKKCGTVLVPGLTSRQRTKDGVIEISCLFCKSVSRIPIGKRATATPELAKP